MSTSIATRSFARESLSRECVLRSTRERTHRGEVAPEVAFARKQLWREVPMLLTVLLTLALTVWM